MLLNRPPPHLAFRSGQKLSHGLCVKQRSVFFFLLFLVCVCVCLFDSAATRVSPTLDLYVNAVGGKKALECCNHLTHTHLSCPFVPLYIKVQKEPFVESATLTEGHSVTQTAVGINLTLIWFLCWDHRAF